MRKSIGISRFRTRFLHTYEMGQDQAMPHMSRHTVKTNGDDVISSPVKSLFENGDKLEQATTLVRKQLEIVKLLNKKYKFLAKLAKWRDIHFNFDATYSSPSIVDHMFIVTIELPMSADHFHAFSIDVGLGRDWMTVSPTMHLIRGGFNYWGK